MNDKLYILPDGNAITVSTQRFRAPEILFKPNKNEFPGIHALTYQSIMKCDIDLRKVLYSNIVLSGGSTMFAGISERLSKEVIALAQQETIIRVITFPESQFSAFYGGSILSQLSSFQTMWITRAEYDEYGGGIVHRKCF